MSLTASSHASSGIAEIAACAARRSIAFAPSSDATDAAGAASAIPIRACAEGIWGVRCGNVGCEMWECGNVGNADSRLDGLLRVLLRLVATDAGEAVPVWSRRSSHTRDGGVDESWDPSMASVH